MADLDSDSTDSDNNNLVPLINEYFGMPLVVPQFQHAESPDREVDNSSESDIDNQFHIIGSMSSSSEELLHHSSDELDSPSVHSSHSSASSTLFEPFTDEMNSTNFNITTPKYNSWCGPKELYNREIGHYKHSSQWNTKFNQSLVAVQKLKLSKKLKGHEGCVNSLDFNSAGDLIASGSDDFKICLWKWSEGTCILRHNSKHTKNIFQTKFLTTQGDHHIVSSARDGIVMLSAVNDSGVVYSKIIARHGRSCNKLGIHRDLPYVVLSCGDDGIVKNIDIRESPINENRENTNLLNIKNIRHCIMHIYGIDINPFNSSEFIINGDDEIVRMYDKRRLSGPIKEFYRQPYTSEEDNDNNGDVDNEEGASVNNRPSHARLRSPIPQETNITSAVYNYCGTEILASYSEDSIYLFDVNGLPNTYLHSYSGHLNRVTVKGVNFYGPKSDYVISGSDCGYIFIWDKKTEAIVQRKHADTKGAVNVLEPHPHIATLATSGLNKSIKIWEPLNKWKEPNKYKLRKCILNNRLQRDQRIRISRFSGNPQDGVMGFNLPYNLYLRRFF